jgi:Glyoxalase/Bleomycin resistance protein/Dioxygenase superfamily
MKIKLSSVHVDDQEKALRFYTEVLGFVTKADFSQGPYRWLTVASPEARTARSCSWRSTITRRPKPTSTRCSSKASPRPCSSPTMCRRITSA